MKKIYLHIGLYKTATKYIQRILLDNPYELSNQGVYFDHNFFHLFTALREAAPLCETDRTRLRGVFKALYDKCPCDKILLSCEALSGRLTNKGPTADLIAKEIMLAARCFDIHLIVGVRRQDTFIESMYNQSIKEGGTLSFKEYYNQVSGLDYNWSRWLDCYPFPKTVIPYEMLITNPIKYVKEFFDVVKPGLQLRVNYDRCYNFSISNEGLDELREINKTMTSHEKQTEIRDIVSLKNIKSEPGPMSHYLHSEIIRKYTVSNIELFRDYLMDSPYLGYYLGLQEIHIDKWAVCPQCEQFRDNFDKICDECIRRNYIRNIINLTSREREPDVDFNPEPQHIEATS